MGSKLRRSQNVRRSTRFNLRPGDMSAELRSVRGSRLVTSTETRGSTVLAFGLLVQQVSTIKGNIVIELHQATTVGGLRHLAVGQELSTSLQANSLTPLHITTVHLKNRVAGKIRLRSHHRPHNLGPRRTQNRNHRQQNPKYLFHTNSLTSKLTIEDKSLSER